MCSPTAGASQFCSTRPMTSRPPAHSAPTARMDVGISITFGASCGRKSSRQRDLLQNVIDMSRVM